VGSLAELEPENPVEPGEVAGRRARLVAKTAEEWKVALVDLAGATTCWPDRTVISGESRSLTGKPRQRSPAAGQVRPPGRNLCMEGVSLRRQQHPSHPTASTSAAHRPSGTTARRPAVPPVRDEDASQGCAAPSPTDASAVARRQHAEFVAFGVGKHGPRGLRLVLADVDPGRTPSQQCVDQRGPVISDMWG
jgi:hypothetical protein